MERMPFDWFLEVPPVTRAWTAAITLVSILEQCKVVTELQLLYNYRQVFVGHEYWRLLTSFLYFGPLSINLMVYAYFVARYSRMLEESFYAHKTGEYLWLIFFISSTLIGIVSFIPASSSSSFPFLGPYLSNALVYIWARRNPDIQLSFLGLFVFSAPYLPWVMMIFSAVVNSSSPKGELIGIFVGHIYFFFEDIYPSISNNGSRPLAPPWLWFQRIQTEEEERLMAAHENARHPTPPPQPAEVPQE